MKRRLIPALLLILVLTACGGDSSGGSGAAGSGEVWAEDGYAEARIGDVVHSYFKSTAFCLF